jgi:hypothetical protein
MIVLRTFGRWAATFELLLTGNLLFDPRDGDD